MNLKKYYKIIFNLLIIFFLISLMFYPKEVVESAKKGLLLWFNAVLPSLFPFIVCTNILVELNIFRYIGVLFKPVMKLLFNLPGATSFVWLSGITSGYPVGAKITVDLLNKKEITKMEAQHLLNFCNNSGPLFILGTVAVGMLNEPSIGYFLLVVHICSSIIVGIFYRFVYNKHKSKDKIICYKKNEPTYDIGKLLGNSIYDAMELILQIGGFIILFSVILHMIQIYNVTKLLWTLIMPICTYFNLSKDIIQSFMLGLIEITNGINFISNTNANLISKVIFINFLITWSGFSVHAQTASVIKSSPLSLKKYLKAKLFQSLIAVLITLILFPFF